MSAYRLATFDPSSPLFQEVLRLHNQVLPGDPEGAEAMFRRHATYPGYRAVAALDEAGRPVGYAYGYTSAPGQFYHGKLSAALGEELSARWLAHCFEFVEFGVAEHVRRQGVGRLVHDALLTDLPHATSVLTTWVQNEGARAFYRRCGWQDVLEPFYPGPDNPYVVMGIDLWSR